jgi:hypothetical protein
MGDNREATPYSRGLLYRRITRFKINAYKHNISSDQYLPGG